MLSRLLLRLMLGTARAPPPASAPPTEQLLRLAAVPPGAFEVTRAFINVLEVFIFASVNLNARVEVPPDGSRGSTSVGREESKGAGWRGNYPVDKSFNLRFIRYWPRSYTSAARALCKQIPRRKKKS